MKLCIWRWIGIEKGELVELTVYFMENEMNGGRSVQVYGNAVQGHYNSSDSEMPQMNF